MRRPSVAAARAYLVHDLCARGAIRTARIAEAFQRVPRHVFLPDADPVEAYADRAIPVKYAGDRAVSACSQPTMTALMLSALAPRAEERVLEIGTGTGYVAALLKELVGRRGDVVSIDHDEELIARARRHLADAGYAPEMVRVGDGNVATLPEAPFDAVIATAAVVDIPRPWIEQVRFGGRLLVPMHIRRMPKVVLFERRARSIASRLILDGMFMPLEGTDLSDGMVAVDPAALAALRLTPPREVPLNVQRDDIPALAWWLALTDDNCVGEQPAIYRSGELAEIVDAPGGVCVRAYGPDHGAMDCVLAAVATWTAADAPGLDRVRIEGYVDAREADQSLLARQAGARVIPLRNTTLVVGSG